jgi:hypothetical protein
VYFWTLSIIWCPKPKKIIDKELKTPKRPKYKPQNNKHEQTHTHTQNTKPENTNGNKMTHVLETGSVSILTWVVLLPFVYSGFVFCVCARAQVCCYVVCILVFLCFVGVFVQVCCSVVRIFIFLGFLVVYNFLVLGHQMMDKVQKYASINANTPSSETYRSDLRLYLFITALL